MDEYILEVTETLSGVHPVRIILDDCQKINFAMLEKITDRYFRPDRIWFRNIKWIMTLSLRLGNVNVIKSIFARYPDLTFSMRWEKYTDCYNVYGNISSLHSEWKYKLNINGEKHTETVTARRWVMEELMADVGCRKNSGVWDYYYPEIPPSKMMLVFDWATF